MYKVALKEIDAQRVISIRETVPTIIDVMRPFGEICDFMRQNGVRPVGPAVSIYHDTKYSPKDVDVEVAVPTDALLPDNDRFTIRQLSGVTEVAFTVHQGGYDKLCIAIYALVNWLKANGYRIVGPRREIFLRCPYNASAYDDPTVDASNLAEDDPDSYVTEVQFPVEKA